MEQQLRFVEKDVDLLRKQEDSFQNNKEKIANLYNKSIYICIIVQMKMRLYMFKAALIL